MQQTVYLIPHHHFDPTWRRCFARPAVYHGVTVRSYAEVEAHCINAWLALTERGYTFSDGQAVVWRTYLQSHPEQREKLRALADTGQLEVLLAGETVQDTNLSSAEGLVRNFLQAEPFYREFVGAEHPALVLASTEDAFGNSPNYPQVLRGVGAQAVLWPSYRTCPEPIWVGIDGSGIPVWDQHPGGMAGGFAKHPPCTVCAGAGCAACADTGLQFVDGFDLVALERSVVDALAQHPDSPWISIRFLTEEILPDSRVVDFMESWNSTHADTPIKFAGPRTIFDLHRKVLDDALAERDATPSIDLNPAMSGCYVSRIRCKQRTRAIAYQLLAAEAALATESWESGTPVAPPALFAEAWRQVAFNQFHDAITGTHIDNAHDELMEMLDRAEAIAAPYLPAATVPDNGHFTVLDDGATTLTMGALDITVDRCGILAITRDGIDLFGEFPAPWNNLRRRPRIAELMLEPDFGDAWSTRISAPTHPTSDFHALLLGDFHTNVQASATALRWHGIYNGGDRKVRRLAWTVTAAISADGQRLEFDTEVEWDTESRRLRVVVPVRATDATATYEVPFGFIDRTYDPAKLDYNDWCPNTQEFPALHWVRKAVTAQSGVVLFNKGLPCYRWQPGVLDLSLLRSPEYAFCVVEPASYEFWDTDGQRDSGRHHFAYSLFPDTEGTSLGELTRLGYEYNLPAPVQPPFQIAGDVVVTAWKPAEDGNSWILRLQESGGNGTNVEITFEQPRTVTSTDLLEHPQGTPTCTAYFSSPLHRHGLLTLHIR